MELWVTLIFFVFSRFSKLFYFYNKGKIKLSATPTPDLFSIIFVFSFIIFLLIHVFAKSYTRHFSGAALLKKDLLLPLIGPTVPINFLVSFSWLSSLSKITCLVSGKAGIQTQRNLFPEFLFCSLLNSTRAGAQKYLLSKYFMNILAVLGVFSSPVYYI